MIAWRIKKVKKKTKTYFEATYKYHKFIIAWNFTNKVWNINVTDKNKQIAYSGFWGNETENIDDAIYEAMRGSGLL